MLARELTKKFEEFLRGTPAELLAAVQKRSLKGRICGPDLRPSAVAAVADLELQYWSFSGCRRGPDAVVGIGYWNLDVSDSPLRPPGKGLPYAEGYMSPWAIVLRTGLAIAFAAQVQAAEVGLIKVKGAIGPATANYIARAIEVSTARKDACLIIQLDTPGGSLESTKDIVQTFYDSHVPIVVYVAPAGAWAGSAGCFITLAADVAAMAPSTSIGAAHPVSVGAGGAKRRMM